MCLPLTHQITDNNNITMNFIALRADIVPDLALSALLAFIALWASSYLVVRESGDETGKDHLHAVLVMDEKKNLQSMRMQLRRKFPCLVGNKALYSLAAVRDVEKYDRYMCKGASEEEMPVILGSLGLKYSLEYIEECHSNYWRLNFQHQKDKKAAGKNKLSFTDFLEEEAKKRKILWTDVEKLRELYIELSIGENRRGQLNKNQCESIINVLIGRLCPDDRYIEFLKNKLFGEFFGLETAGLQQAEPFL